jgi:ABC-type phosphate/phosphonate transport system substrate-binding protein
MVAHANPVSRRREGIILFRGAVTAFLFLAPGIVRGQPVAAPGVLRIGTTATVMESAAGLKATVALATLRAFIKDETGLENEILPQKGWRQLANKMVTGEIQVGVFQGHEFAWCQKEQAGLKPLALAVNVNRYPVGCVVAHRDNPATDFTGLEGKILSIPRTGPACLRLFVERECQSSGSKTASGFFAEITAPASSEDALDDVVDGNPHATVVDRAALEDFKRSKPARFKKLKLVAHSQPFPPPVVAYYSDVLDEATRTRFQKGLLGAGRKAMGELILAHLHLTGFETAPEDFGKVLAQTHLKYPPPKEPAK